MTKIAVGFNDEGASCFKEWMKRVAVYPDCMQHWKWFDTLEYANWDTGENTQIELGSVCSKSGHPQIYVVPKEHVEFVDA